MTTRTAFVAKSCYCFHGTVYVLRPLSEADSMSLFYKRIFGSEDLCPINLKDVATQGLFDTAQLISEVVFLAFFSEAELF